MSTQFHPLKVKQRQADAQDALILSFEVPAPLREAFRFTQGQHLTLRATLGGVEQRRSYSICAGVDDGELRVGVRRVAGGLFSNWVHDTLQAGSTVEVLPPEGRFFVPLDPAAERHYLGIAGGSGITPILSILKTVLAGEPRSRFTLIYGNRQVRSTMFKEELEDLKNRYLTRLVLHPVFSRELMDMPLHSGRLDRAKLAQFLGPLVDARSISHAFVCGPHAVNDEAEAALLAAGVAAERIHIERFGLPGDAATGAAHTVQPGDVQQATVHIQRDGRRHTVAFRAGHGSILEAAADAGLEVPYSCKSGVCCTCRAKLLEGQVRMDRNFALDKADLARGFVLSCQAHPLTDTVVLSFDER